MLTSDLLAKALGITRPRLSQLLGAYNLSHPDAKILPDGLTEGKRGKPGNLYAQERVESIRQALGVK